MIAAADTHAFLWHVTGQTRRLGARARIVFQRVEQGRAVVHVSVISLHEISVLMGRGRLRAAMSWERWIEIARGTPGIVLQDVTLADVDEARALSGVPDPTDRLIAGMARRLDVPLITGDERLADSPHVKVLW